jgi:hypothetical protein
MCVVFSPSNTRFHQRKNCQLTRFMAAPQCHFTVAINQVVSKRMVKKRQMRWTDRGAHLLLQVRTRVLNEEWRSTLSHWYPAMQETSDAKAA